MMQNEQSVLDAAASAVGGVTANNEPLWRRVLTPGLVALYGVSFLSGFSLGVFNPLIALRMSQQGIGDFWIGLTATTYFLLIALAAPVVARALPRAGLTVVITAGLVASAGVALILPSAQGMPAWFGLRAALGLAVCLYMIGGQTGLNTVAEDDVRATAAAAHAGAFGMGFAISPLIGSFLYLISPTAAFWTAAIVIALGALLVALQLPRIVVAPGTPGGPAVLRRVRLPAYAGFTYGFFESAFVSLFSVYLLRQGVTIAQGGIALSLFVVGGTVGMGPVSFWGDRLGRERILAAAALTGLVAILTLVFRPDVTGAMIGAALLGASLGPVFPLALAMIGARLKSTELAQGSSVFTAWFAYGCAAGPLVAAGAMSAVGPRGLFAGTFALLIGLAIWAFRARHEHVPTRAGAERRPFFGSGDDSMIPQRKPLITRRRFLLGSTVFVGGTAGAVYGIGELGKWDPSAAPYAYWRRIAPDGMSDAEFIVMCGVLAANPHNTQPWRFRVEPGVVEIWNDVDRHLGAADPARRMMKMGLGCALENMRLAARHLGYANPREEVDEQAQHIFLHLGEKGEPVADPLFGAIFKRQTTRTPFDLLQHVPVEWTAALSDQASGLGIAVRWYREESLRSAIADVHRSAVRAWMTEAKRHSDAVKWWRHTREEWETKRDGISIFTSGLPAFFRAAGPALVSREQIEGDAGREQEIGWVDSIVDPTPLWAVVHGTREDWSSCVNAGRFLERVYLEAARDGLAVCPLVYASELPRMSEQLKAVLNIPEGEHVFIVCRIGQGRPLEKSVRRELKSFII